MNKKYSKKKTLALAITLILMCSNSMQVHAAEKECSKSNRMYCEVDKLIAEVDKYALIQDAKNEIMDERVSADLLSNVTATVDFTPIEGVEGIDFNIYSTVQKVGDFVNDKGETSTLYVTAAAAIEPTIDRGYNKKYDVEAYIYIYWIDNLGTNNELYAISVSWNPHGLEVSNRTATYGVVNITTLFYDESTDISIYQNDYYKNVHGEYTGFILGCSSSIYVTNLGTVTCYAQTTF